MHHPSQEAGAELPCPGGSPGPRPPTLSASMTLGHRAQQWLYLPRQGADCPPLLDLVLPGSIHVGRPAEVRGMAFPEAGWDSSQHNPGTKPQEWTGDQRTGHSCERTLERCPCVQDTWLCPRKSGVLSGHTLVLTHSTAAQWGLTGTRPPRCLPLASCPWQGWSSQTSVT